MKCDCVSQFVFTASDRDFTQDFSKLLERKNWLKKERVFYHKFFQLLGIPMKLRVPKVGIPVWFYLLISIFLFNRYSCSSFMEK